MTLHVGLKERIRSHACQSLRLLRPTKLASQNEMAAQQIFCIGAVGWIKPIENDIDFRPQRTPFLTNMSLRETTMEGYNPQMDECNPYALQGIRIRHNMKQRMWAQLSTIWSLPFGPQKRTIKLPIHGRLLCIVQSAIMPRHVTGLYRIRGLALSQNCQVMAHRATCRDA